MATIAQWIEGARPRTLPAAIAPVIVGTGAAAALGEANLGLALLALIVSVRLLIGVIYANV
jgi:1,4-dihydroxy-2-naphthoate octaprenyltransferase